MGRLIMVAPNSKLKVKTMNIENYHEWLRQEVTTLDNAILWHDTSEKFTFCLDLLELSLCKNGDSYCDHYVCELEDKFEKLLFAFELAQDEQIYHTDFT